MGVIEDIAVRITDCSCPTAGAKAGQEVKVVTLPKLSAPLKEGQILRAPPRATNRTEAAEGYVGGFAKSFGESSGSTPMQVLWAYARDALLSEGAKKALNWDNMAEGLSSAGVSGLGSRAAAIFRETSSRRAKMAILGTPRSDLRPILLSINSITHLVVVGIEEDSYGIVNKDVAHILRTFANISNQINTFMREFPAPRSDDKSGDASGQGKQDIEIELVLYHLRAALRMIIKGYEEYANDMGLGPTEIREARIAAGLPLAGHS